MSVERIPLADRPRFAAKMIAVWRWHHMARGGEDLTVYVKPGEWPDDAPRQVKGVRVEDNDQIGGEGAVLVLGRVNGRLRGALQVAAQIWHDSRCSPAQLAIATAFMEFDDDLNMTLWLHPDPQTGETPVWQRPGKH